MVEGEDTQTYLHSQLSQDLRDLARSASRRTRSCSTRPARSWLSHTSCAVERRRYVLDTDAGSGEVLAARLNRFKIRVKAEITTIPWRCIALRATGDDAVAIAATAGAVALPAWWGDGTTIDLIGPAPVAPAELPEGDADALSGAHRGWLASHGCRDHPG